MAELTDEVLIEHYRKDGSKQAINLLYQRYWNEVNHFIEWKYYVTPEDSKDLTQNIFLSLSLKIENHYLEQGHFRSWLFRVVNNYMIDYLRKNKRMLFVTDCDIESLQAYGNDVQAELKEIMFEQVSRNIDELIGELPLEKKRLMELKFKEHKSFQEIADMYGLKKSTCVKRIRVICQKMHEELVRRGFNEIPDEE